jgi:hypothetical protein
MASSASEMLSIVNAAITALLNGGASSYSIGARSVTKLDLGELREWRKELEIEVARESGGGIFRKAVIRRPSP